MHCFWRPPRGKAMSRGSGCTSPSSTAGGAAAAAAAPGGGAAVELAAAAADLSAIRTSS